MATSNSLWPEDLFGTTTEKAPLTILKEQAVSLGKMSGFRLNANILTSTSLDMIRHTFYIVVPSLDNYRYELFEIEHGPLPYPVTVISTAKSRATIASATGRDEPKLLHTEQEFIAWLRNLFAAPEIKRILSSLISMVNA